MPAIIAAVPTARSEARNVGPSGDNTMMKYYSILLSGLEINPEDYYFGGTRRSRVVRI